MSRRYDRGAAAVPLLPILFVNFMGALGFSLVLPFLVFLVTDWGGNAVIYGIAGATYSAFQLVGAPILGRWSDRVGRRRILLLSQVGTLVSWLVFLAAFFLPVSPLWSMEGGPLGAFVLTLPLLVLLVARALDGSTGGIRVGRQRLPRRHHPVEGASSQLRADGRLVEPGLHPGAPRSRDSSARHRGGSWGPYSARS